MSRNGARTRSTLSDANEAPSERREDAVAEPSPTGGIDADLIGELARLISASDLAELEIEKGDLRIRMVRYSPAPAVHPTPASAANGIAPITVAMPTAAVEPAVVATTDLDHPGAVRSPMVGTAYRRASPESKAFVDIGSTVKVGDKVLLVEAMKTFNEIVAPRGGTVTAIFIDDGQPVEYGEPLLVIE